MKKMQFIFDTISTRKGLLLFLLGLILLWIGGYALIDTVSPDDWTRYLRQRTFSRITLAIALGIVFYASFPHLKNTISNTSKTATDLSVFRILFFGFFAVGFLTHPKTLSEQILPFLDLPISAQVPLPFMGWYPKVVPMNETLVQIALVLFYISIFTSFLGIKTRWSIVLFTLTAFYLFAIPNFYGKVNHNHELVWFPAILAFSPCADRYSIDAYFRKRRNKTIRHSATAYTMPFLLIWAMMGLIYFFPGLWKMWSNGLDWCFTDNVRNQMYYKWFALGEWLPYFRIDHYPFLYKSSGLFTLIFELFFIPLFLNKKTRRLAILMGIGFHFGTLVFMNIFFVVLVLTYLSFINWHCITWFRETIDTTRLITTDKKFALVKWIGGTLIFFSILFGFGKWNSWPFTVYPTFDAIVAEETNHLVFVGVTNIGERIELSIQTLHDEYTSPRYAHMEYNMIESQKEDNLDTLLLNSFVKVYSREFKQLKMVEFYIEKQSVIPEKRARAPRRFIYSKRVPF